MEELEIGEIQTDNMTRRRNEGGGVIPIFVIGDDSNPWGGLNTATKDTRFLKRGETYDSMNWITGRDKDHIELRLGSSVLGKTFRRVSGAHVTGLAVGVKNSGEQIPFFSYMRKLLWYDASVNDTVEVNTTDIFPAAASGEDIAMAPYENLAGSFIYITSPHSSIYKADVANPGYVADEVLRIEMQPIDFIDGGSGQNDIVTSQTYNGVVDITYIITISGTTPDLFDWTDGTNSASNVPVSASPTLLSHGFSVSWEDITGHNVGDKWIVKFKKTDTSVTDFHFAFIKINRARMFGMFRNGTSQASQDVTGLYLSHLDRQLADDFANKIAVAPKPVLVEVPGGGSIPDNTYYFVLTEIGPSGEETIQGEETSITTSSGGDEAIEVSFPNIAGASQYYLYGSLVSGTYLTPSLASPVGIQPDPSGTTTFTLTDVNFVTGAPPSSSAQDMIVDIATGDGVTDTFTGQLPFSLAPLTPFYINITDSVELFIDNRSGLLVGSLGGTGTINYITGVYSVTFNTPPTNGKRITASYYLEDATVDGVADFVINPTDTTNSAAQIFRQDDGGGRAMAVWPYQGVEYCLHVLRSWLLNIAVDSAGSTFNNQPYYEQIGIPYPRASFPTGDGLLFLNNANPQQPTVSILRIPEASTNLTVVPESISQDLDLSNLGVESAVIYRAGDYDIAAGRAVVDGLEQSYNSLTYIRNVNSDVWNLLDYSFTCLAEYGGQLISGDSLSANVFKLFSGLSDSGAIIRNHWKSAYTDLNIDGLKKVGYINLEGLIQRSQKLEVWISLDNGPYYYVYTILGTGPYVNTAGVVTIGTSMIGTNVIGGGSGATTQFTANQYEIDIPIHTGKFEYISFMIKAIDVGYVSVDHVRYKDIRWKRRRILSYEDLEINN